MLVEVARTLNIGTYLGPKGVPSYLELTELTLVIANFRLMIVDPSLLDDHYWGVDMRVIGLIPLLKK